MSYLIIELETQLLKTGKTSADLIRATGHTPANISKLRNGKIILVTDDEDRENEWNFGEKDKASLISNV